VVEQPASAPRRPSTPTVQQGGPVGGTPTVQQGAAGSTPTAVASGVPEFPAPLRSRFEPLAICGQGSEAVVWRCRRPAENDEVAVKVHWAGQPIDMALLRHLRNPEFHRHVPELHDFGSFVTPHGAVGWVAMEFFPETLEQLVRRETDSRGLPQRRAREVLAELAAALDFWQRTVNRNPLDFKPDNLMRRSGDELQFVIADFGGVTAFTASKQFGGTAMAAVAYAPPEEVWQEKSSPWPWWSLGEIAYLLVTGRTRFQRADGPMRSDQAIRRERMMGELHLDDVPDEHWRLLISGLLTRDPNDRWTWNQVRAWLSGGRPAVITRGFHQTTAPAHRPITFVDGRTFTDPALLAAAMLDDWRAADRWLSGDGRQTLHDWLTREKLDKRFDLTRLRSATVGSPRLHSAVLAFGAAFAPEVTPRYRGHAVDRDGLVQLLSTTEGFSFAGELVTGDVLGTAGGYRCAHDRCTGGRCTVLDRAAGELPSLVADAERVIAETGASAGWGQRQLLPGERDRLHGLALLIALRPRDAARVVEPPARLRYAQLPWWRELCRRVAATDPDSYERRGLLLAQGVLQERALREQASALKNTRKTVHNKVHAIARRAGAALLVFLAMLAISWSAAVLRNGDAAFSGDLASAVSAARLAAEVQMALAAALLVLAVELVVFGLGRGLLITGGVVAAMVPLLPVPVPPFTAFELPEFVAGWLLGVARLWGNGLGTGVLIAAVAGVVCLIAANALLPDGLGYRPNRSIRARRATVGSRIALGALGLVAMLAVLWAAVVLRLTFNPGTVVLLAPEIGVHAAGLQSGYLLVLVLVALVAATAWQQSGAVLTIGGLGAAAAGLWAQAIPELSLLWSPVAAEPLTWFAGLWGAGAFWAVLLVHLPVALACSRGVRQETGG
jgi:hypothetical protein